MGQSPIVSGQSLCPRRKGGKSARSAAQTFGNGAIDDGVASIPVQSRAQAERHNLQSKSVTTR